MSDFLGYRELFGVDGGSIRAAAQDPKLNSDVIAALAAELDADDRAVAGQIEGDIKAGTRTNPKQAASLGREIAFRGYYAVGLLNSFAAYVDAFDSKVDDLNRRLAVEAARRFNKLRNIPDAPTLQEFHNQVKAELVGEYRRAELALEDGADEVAAGFNQGANAKRMKELVAAGFLPLAAVVQFPQITYTPAELRDLRKLLERDGRLKDFFAPPPLGTSSKQIKQLVELARRMGVKPTVFAAALKQMYVTRAAERAGIDLTTWDVTKGAGGVAKQYERTYEYYAQLYKDNPNFRWAAMAAMIGPSFAGGFEDLRDFRRLADLFSKLPRAATKGIPVDALAQLTEEDIAYYEQTFLQMQKDIFYDASMMHEAYNENGMGGIKELRAAGLLGEGNRQADQAYNSWRDIDEGIRTGNKDLINRGNEGMLYREQFYTIARQYDNMRERPVTGEAMTWAMGLVGQPSIPGTQTLAQVEGGFTVPVDMAPIFPGVQGGEVTVNVPRGNISDFDTRWNLIQRDTLPTFIDLVEKDPQKVSEILDRPVRDRINDNRLVVRLPQIAGSLVDGRVRLW